MMIHFGALLASEDPTITHHWLLPETAEIIYGGLASVIVIGALVQILPPEAGTNGRPDQLIQWLAFAGIVLTAVNMFGGFAVTRRMLAMFRK